MKLKNSVSAKLLFFSFFLVALSLAMSRISAYFPDIVEKYYSRWIYRFFSGVGSKYFNLFHFSCSEILFYSCLIFGAFLVVLLFKNLFKKQFLHLLRLIAFTLSICSIGYFLFVLMWGLNYNRQPIEKSLRYRTGSTTAKELSEILSKETSAINSLCDKINFDQNGHSYYAGGFEKISIRVNAGYVALANKGGAFSELFYGSAGARPKGILASKLLSYFGVEGVFVPFTYEPNVDNDLPEFVLPFDAAHETAHLMGFAREQEANFVAYLANTANTDTYFQYSAHLEAYIYLSNALYETDATVLKKISPRLDSRAMHDLEYYNNYINAHNGKVADISNKINDSYLKMQGQQGVITYDMFVILLADKYRS